MKTETLCYSVNGYDDIIWNGTDTSLQCIFESESETLIAQGTYTGGTLCCESPSGTSVGTGNYTIWIAHAGVKFGNLNADIIATHCSGTCDTCTETPGCHWCLSTHQCTIKKECTSLGISGCPCIPYFIYINTRYRIGESYTRGTRYRNHN